MEPEPKPAAGRRLSPFWIVAGLVAIWCVFLAFFGPKPGSDLSPPDLNARVMPRPADFGWALADLDGRPVDLAKYRGKAVFLNVWATWCPPCVAELPSIARLARNPRHERVAFVCVSIDRDLETVRRYLQGKDLPMTVLHAADLPPSFTTGAIPATFLIAADGRIAASAVGGAEWDDPSVVQFLERLASAKPEPAAETGREPD